MELADEGVFGCSCLSTCQDRNQERTRDIAAIRQPRTSGPSSAGNIASLPAHPVRFEFQVRWQVSWLAGLGFALPSRLITSGIVRRRSPLTVAGAATVSVPIGYASPCSLFISGVVLPKKPSVPINRGKNAQGNQFHLPRWRLSPPLRGRKRFQHLSPCQVLEIAREGNVNSASSLVGFV